MKHSVQASMLTAGLGLSIAAGIVAMILWLTNDMRWVLTLGSMGLFGAAVWRGSLRRDGAVGFFLLCLPLTLIYVVFVVPELPDLWPHLLFWLAFALLGWWGFRSRSISTLPRVAVTVVLATLAGWYALAYVPVGISRSLDQVRDDPAPEFSLEDLNGHLVPVESLEGRVVVLDFFATWCAPCIAELPEINAVSQRYANAADVEVLVVANDSGGDTPEAIREFVDERQLDVPFAYDHDGKAHQAFGFAGLPGLVVIDRHGRIRFSREGFNAAETDFQENLVRTIESLRAP